MFVRFPIILARPTSLRGSLSPGPWPQVTGRTPAAVFPHTVAPRRRKTNFWALWFLLFLVPQAMEKHSAGPAGFVCVCPGVSPVCVAVHAALLSPSSCLQRPAGSAWGWFLHAAHGQHVPMGRTLSLVKG